MIHRKCKYCGMPFQRRRSKSKGHKYCSPECRREANNRKRWRMRFAA